MHDTQVNLILTPEQIEIIKEGSGNASWIVQLCNSHEALRLERDIAITNHKKILYELVEKSTVRETGWTPSDCHVNRFRTR
jgi:hypothetical protein